MVNDKGPGPRTVLMGNESTGKESPLPFTAGAGAVTETQLGLQASGHHADR